jgi:hypothetical protein
LPLTRRFSHEGDLAESSTQCSAKQLFRSLLKRARAVIFLKKLVIFTSSETTEKLSCLPVVKEEGSDSDDLPAPTASTAASTPSISAKLVWVGPVSYSEQAELSKLTNKLTISPRKPNRQIEGELTKVRVHLTYLKYRLDIDISRAKIV